MIQKGEFESDVLTDAEAIDILVELGQWGGIGLIITGLLLLVALGIAVVIMHGRARANNAATPAWILGIVGAIVTMFLSFIPFSPVLGGATASHLNPDPKASGLGTGTLAGIIGSLPVLIITVFAGFGLFIGTPSELAPAVAVLLAITATSTLLYYIVLSALGSYLGTWLRKYRHDA